MVPVGSVLFTVEDGKKSEPAPVPAMPPPASDSIKPAPGMEMSPQPAVVATATRVQATPAVRRLARELGVDLQNVPGTGSGGRVSAEDVRRFVTAPPAAILRPSTEGGVEPSAVATSREGSVPSAVNAAPEERIPLRGLRRAIAKHMVQSVHTAPHVSSFERCEVSALIDLRRRLVPLAQERSVALTFLPFIVKAVVVALKACPWLNATIDDEREEIVVKHAYHIGVATATPEGLMVPVIRDADRLSLLDVAESIQQLSQAARDRTAHLEELQGGTFTITNFGAYGGSFGTPIINYPEVAILGVGRIKPEPWVHDNQLVVGQVLPLTLAFDHRLIDGEMAHRFLDIVMNLLSNPDRLMLEG